MFCKHQDICIFLIIVNFIPQTNFKIKYYPACLRHTLRLENLHCPRIFPFHSPLSDKHFCGRGFSETRKITYKADIPRKVCHIWQVKVCCLSALWEGNTLVLSPLRGTLPTVNSFLPVHKFIASHATLFDFYQLTLF